MKQFNAQTVIVSLVGVLVSGTVFFHYVEGWSWLDSYFFTVVTISTVGYGSLVPVTALGKIGTTAFIFVGLGVFAVAIQQFAVYQMQKHKENAEWLVGHLGHDLGHRAKPAANDDDQPETTKGESTPDTTARHS
ncbi:potassium channel family protein [Sedimentitalea todarodis]|uniref:Potassium channel family protein n=1 Tax=Sedimentitalea todarodis TaxID=1631240 RepID=A0ABU3VJQ7_9RHOB|nr:potassium channel family protein [Sedimentitalea todarodis]MDU9006395.1 potassium channel family protein [Sedimentitalea todarodis]